MGRRRRQALWMDSFELPAMPFLAIMLGLVSVMALAAISIAREKHDEMEAIKGVELVGIPARFVPFHVRCQEDRVQWRNDAGEWESFDQLGMLVLLDERRREAYGIEPITDRSATDFRDYLLAKAEANKRLSFSRRQNTLIMWVEPKGAQMSGMMQSLISGLAPIRIGLLPIMPGERIEKNVQR
ncbi:MAG: hypothetical protein ACI8W8_003593 [Rhodothermales bacterium]|jgi:hypothetical protein